MQAIRDIGLHHSLEFAAVSSVYTFHGGRLYSTPSSKADVHAAPWLSLQDKRTVSLFLANAQLAAAGGSSDLFQAPHFKAALEDFGLHASVQVRGDSSDATRRLPRPHVWLQTAPRFILDFRQLSYTSRAPCAHHPVPHHPATRDRRRLTARLRPLAPHASHNRAGVPSPTNAAHPDGTTCLQEGLLYSVYQAESHISRETPLAGADVLQAMVKYMSQSGAYVVGQAPYIESRYGSGDVAQAFIRQACVYGAAVALGTPVSHILVSDGAVHGVRTASGHTIRCSSLFASAAYLRGFADGDLAGASPTDAPDGAAGSGQVCCEEEAAEAEEAAVRGGAMARGIAVLRHAVLPYLTNCQIVFPPGTCGNKHTVTAWHCHHTLAVCPAPSVVLHLSLPHAAGEESLRALRACVRELLKTPDDSAANATASSVDGDVKADTAEPGEGAAVSDEDPLLAECYYIQDLSGGDRLKACAGVVCCPAVGRDWTLDKSLLISERLFKKAFPDDVFLTNTTPVTAHAGEDEEIDPLDAALKDLGLE